MAGFIPKHGGYENLKSYQKAVIIFMATYYLAEKWVRVGSRTRDQMEQSARSGKQNIVEGSLASATSKQSEIHLTNVARSIFLGLLSVSGLPGNEAIMSGSWRVGVQRRRGTPMSPPSPPSPRSPAAMANNQS